MKLTKVALAVLTLGLASAAQAADADRIAQLEAQMKVLMAQLEALKTSTQAANKDVAEVKDQMAAQSKEVVVAGDIPGSFRVPGSETSAWRWRAPALGDNGISRRRHVGQCGRPIRA